MDYSNYQWISPKNDIQFNLSEQLTNDQLVDIIYDKIKTKTPFSLIRIGDGELAVLSQELVLSQNWLKKNIWWYGNKSYCGITMPDLKTRDIFIHSIKQANMIGVYCDDEFTNRIFSAIDYKPKQHCYAFANVQLCYIKKFVNLLRENPPLLIGRLAQQFANLLKRDLNINVSGIYTDINGIDDIPKTIEYMKNIKHDWSLVSAGVNADIISPIMAREYGKVCIDYGQGMDTLLDSKYNGQYYLNK